MEKLAVLMTLMNKDSGCSDPITRRDPTFQPKANIAAKNESLILFIPLARPSRIKSAIKTPKSSAPAKCPTVFIRVGSRTLPFANICFGFLIHDTAAFADTAGFMTGIWHHIRKVHLPLKVEKS